MSPYLCSFSLFGSIRKQNPSPNVFCTTDPLHKGTWSPRTKDEESKYVQLILFIRETIRRKKPLKPPRFWSSPSTILHSIAPKHPPRPIRPPISNMSKPPLPSLMASTPPSAAFSDALRNDGCRAVGREEAWSAASVDERTSSRLKLVFAA